MITPATAGDNLRAAVLAAACLTLVCLAACGGSNDDRAETPNASTSGTTHHATDCGLVVTDHALADYWHLADRVAAGEQVDVAAMGNLTAGPVWDRWRRSFEPEPLTAARVGRALFIAVRSQDELPERLRQKTVPLDLVRNYEVTLEMRRPITAHLAAITADELLCDVHDLLAPWLVPAAMPDTLRVDYLVSHPEIRLYEDHVMVDASLAWAVGREQLVRFVASTVYRDRAALEGENPEQESGPAILMEMLRVLCNEAVPTHLDRMTDVVFDPRHALLGGATPAPYDVCEQAQRTIISLDTDLTHVRTHPRDDGEGWRHLYRLFVGSRSTQPTGWYMGQVIIDRFGEERLAAVVRSAADFVATYQEAALMSPAEPATEPGSIAWFVETAPPFTAENARWIDEQLRQRFQ